MKNRYYQEEYKGYILKKEDDYLAVYDKNNNFLKRKFMYGRGTRTSLKKYIDEIIKKYGE